MKRLTLLLLVALFAVQGCKSLPKDDGSNDNIEKKFNLKFVGYDSDINDPNRDRRSFYKIYIDKFGEEGRTTIGLESQKKTYETNLDNNRHLISVEKWVLDEKSNSYIKLNNIEQPNPNYIYFFIPEGKSVIIKLKTKDKRKAEFQVEID